MVVFLRKALCHVVRSRVATSSHTSTRLHTTHPPPHVSAILVKTFELFWAQKGFSAICKLLRGLATQQFITPYPVTFRGVGRFLEMEDGQPSGEAGCHKEPYFEHWHSSAPKNSTSIFLTVTAAAIPPLCTCRAPQTGLLAGLSGFAFSCNQQVTCNQ